MGLWITPDNHADRANYLISLQTQCLINTIMSTLGLNGVRLTPFTPPGTPYPTPPPPIGGEIRLSKIFYEKKGVMP